MSIRAEEAVNEASRFSLRTTLIGDAPRRAPPTPRPVPTQQPVRVVPFSIAAAATAAAPVAAAPVPMTALTFTSIVRPSHSAFAAAPPRDPQATIRALEQIAQAQRRGAAATATAIPVVPTPTAANSRILKAGYISGGSGRTQHDSQAEILRLTATIDTLQSQMSAQRERLQRTEASLVRANRSMTSEKATANARLLRATEELKSLRERESKLRESMTQQVFREPRSQPSFDEAAKRAEQFDAKLAKLTSDAATAAGERDELAKKLVDSTERLQQASTTSQALEKLRADHNELESVRRALAESLETATVDRDALRVRIDEIAMERDASTAERVAESAAFHARVDGLHLERDEATARHTDELATLQAEIASMASKTESLEGDLRVAGAKAETMAKTEFLARPWRTFNNTSIHRDFYDTSTSFTDPSPPRPSSPSPPPLLPPPLVPTAVAHRPTLPKKQKITLAVSTHSSPHTPTLTYTSSASLPRASLARSLGADHFDIGADVQSAEVALLVQAISKDVITATAKQRRRYLLASGLSAAEVEKDLVALESAT